MTTAPPETVGRSRLLTRLGACLGGLLRPRVFGPVLRYDLVRTARQGRTFLLRSAYAFALLVVLFLLYLQWAGGGRDVRAVLTGVTRLSKADADRFASQFFLLFFAVQMGAVLLLTPAYTASAVADEREKKTLDFLLASDLTSREIVLGKLASRLLTLMLVLLGGLPVLSFLQLLGGVDPNLVLAGFAATAAGMLSLGSLGVYNSVKAERPRGAVFTTYAEAVAYLTLSLSCLWIGRGGGLLSPGHWLGAGNVVVAYGRATGGPTGTTAATILPVLRDYVLVHGLFAVLFVVLASRRLRVRMAPAAPSRPVRPTARGYHTSENDDRVPARSRHESRHGPRPRVGEDPILWRELHAEHGLSLPPLARTLLLTAAGMIFAVATVIFLCGIIVTVATGHVSEFANLWARVVGTPIACLLLVTVAVRASLAFSSERDRQTLDSLLTTPLDDRAILAGKWLGSVLSVREVWWALALVWGLGLLAGGVHLLSLLMLAAAWLTYAAFATGVGLWFSLRSRTSLRATVWTLVTLLALGTGQPLLWFVGYPVALALNVWLGVDSGWAADLAYYGLTPPVSLVYLTYPFGEWYSFGRQMRNDAGEVGLAWAGVCVYAAAAAALWGLLRLRFGKATGRMRGGP